MKTAFLEEVKRLPIAERIVLAEAIWNTIPEDAGVSSLPIPAAHRAELDRRLADLEAHPDDGSPWEEVRARLEPCESRPVLTPPATPPTASASRCGRRRS